MGKVGKVDVTCFSPLFCEVSLLICKEYISMNHRISPLANLCQFVETNTNSPANLSSTTVNSQKQIEH